MIRLKLLCGAAAFAALGLAPAAAFAADGPCTSEIAQLGKQLGSQVGMGAPVSEPDAGQHVGKNGASQQASPSAAAGSSSSAGGSQKLGDSAGAAGGVAGAVGAAAGTETAQGIASGQIATSPEDVRRQSEGKPTAAQASMNPNASVATDADKTSQAKMALQRAVDLNAKGDKSCMSAVNDARNLMPKH
jgi:hypothetical protein